MSTPNNSDSILRSDRWKPFSEWYRICKA